MAPQQIDSVGIVVVSHSRALADAAVLLAVEMVRNQQVRIEVAAGLDDTTFGTDAIAISEAITAADGPGGVVVLMDLGSAVLSAELALELVDPEVAARVTLCAAPLVEGLVVAAVSSAGGASRAEVADEASSALAGKQAQLGVAPNASDGGSPTVEPGSQTAEVSATFVVRNLHGLHARPAARLVREVRSYDAEVHVRNLTTGAGPVPAASLSRVATLGALHDHEVKVVAAGPQAQQALDAIVALAGRSFDEHEGSASTRALEERSGGAGPFGASPGIAIGPARHFSAPRLDVEDARSDDPAAERARLNAALAAVRQEIEVARERTSRDASAAEAAIFEAHILLLDDDDELVSDALVRIDRGQAAAPAWAAAAERSEAAFTALDDTYLRARAADVKAVGEQVLRQLVGAGPATIAKKGVLIAADLTPAEAALLDKEVVLGIVLAHGSPTAHSAILARSRGIPAIVGAGDDVLDIADGVAVALDGTTGELNVDPPADVLASLSTRADNERASNERALSAATRPATTTDGVHVHVGANVGSAADTAAAVSQGADLIGLVRTEFLFLDRARAPDVDEQIATYRAIASAADGRRITLRTLDVGGDKPLAYLRQPPEANPFLGVRGIRLALANPDLMRDQLTAIVAVAHESPVSVMFPMVATLDELRRARGALDDAVAAAGKGVPDGLQVGVMVEVPALALKARSIAPYVDFLSIGTNDLTQYTLAAERGNAAVAELGDPLDPGVLQLINLVCRAAGENVLVAVCGELAGDVAAVPLLIGLGVRELSVAGPAVPRVKDAVRATDCGSASTRAETALSRTDAASVRELLEREL